MGRRFRYEGSGSRAGRAGTPASVATADAPGPARDYWIGIAIGYLAAVLTSVGLMLAFVRQGW